MKTQVGQLRVWWKTNGDKETFRVLVDNKKEAKFLLLTLKEYDVFREKICTNSGGIEVWDGDSWMKWEE